ncbi:MAG: radical SAM protein [Thermoleophilaceae bacterium]
MRWDNLRMTEEEEHRLPGYSDPAVVRRFDAPEAMGINFYEVRAKSALNKVPEKSVVPFRWTINPYRGCAHACLYCGSGDTQVLMADGRTKDLGDLRRGDRIVGTETVGRRRRYVVTRILDHWATTKPAQRVALSDGTEVITSGDHRLLSRDGWMHVPDLSSQDTLVGIGRAKRKRTLDGKRTESPTRLRVEAVEPLGIEMPLYDITTGTGDYISNGVVSHNCFARPTHTFLDMNAREDFDKQIVVKVNLPEVLRAQLAKPSWKGEHVALGTNTDPYQWVEKRYKLTRGVWEAMRDFANPCSVLTKSPLLLRDLDLFKELCEVTSFSANLSIPTIDEKIWRQTEPHTPNPYARIEAVAALSEAGIPVGVLVAPLMPGVNDDPEQVDEIVSRCVDAGAHSIGGICLHLRSEVKDIWFDWLAAYRPDLIERYKKLYGRRAYAAPEERERIAALVRSRAPKQSSQLKESRRLMRGNAPAEAPLAPRPRAPAQESLF